MKNKRSNHAVSEIVSVALLLLMTISLFAIVQVVVLSYPFEPSPPSLNLVGSLDQGNILIEHHGGESISLDAKIIFTIGDGKKVTVIAKDYLVSSTSDDDGYWEIGEIISYDPKLDLIGVRVEATVVAKEANSIVMTGIIQGGNS